jgi:hypothetical protein
VPRDKKRKEILLAARRYRDDTSFVMSEQAWREMAVAMGVANQGGVATGYLAPLPEGTTPRGAPAPHVGHRGAASGEVARDTARAPAQAHQHGQTPAAATPATGHEGHARSDTTAPHLRAMMQLHERLLADSIIRRRIAVDPAALRLMRALADSLPPEHREHMRSLVREVERARPASPAARSRPAVRRRPPATTRPAVPTRRPAAKPAPKPADPHAGHRP